jgi:hypothetical protein
MKGTRLPDGENYLEIQPGEYVRQSSDSHIWWFRTPNGIPFKVVDNHPRHHQLAVEPDGTVSLTPSVLCAPGSAGNESGWHGFLTRGEWIECT